MGRWFYGLIESLGRRAYVYGLTRLDMFHMSVDFTWDFANGYLSRIGGGRTSCSYFTETGVSE